MKSRVKNPEIIEASLKINEQVYKFRVSRLDCLQLIRGNVKEDVVRAHMGSASIELKRDCEGNFLLHVYEDGVSAGIIAGSGPYLRCMPASPEICLNGLLPVMVYSQSRTQEFGKHMTINGHMPSLGVATTFLQFKGIMRNMGLHITHTTPSSDVHQQFHVIGLEFFDIFLKFNSKFISKIANIKPKSSKSVLEARALAVNAAHAVQSITQDYRSHAVFIHADTMQVIVPSKEQMNILKARSSNTQGSQLSVRLGTGVQKFAVFPLENSDQLGAFAISVKNSYVLIGKLPLATFRSVSQLCRGDEDTPEFSTTYMKICHMLRTIAFHRNILRGLRDQYENVIECLRHHIKTNAPAMTPWETSNLYYLSGNPDVRCHSLWFFHANPAFLSFVKNA